MLRTILIVIFIVGLTACGNAENPQNAKAKQYFLQGNKLYKASKFKEAISLYNKALRITPKDAMVILKRGDCYRKLRKSRQAIRDYDKVLKLRPSNARAYFHRGTLKIKLGKKSAGCQDVLKAKELCYVPAEQFYSKYCK